MSMRQKLYFGGKSERIWEKIKPVIEQQYNGVSPFFQTFIEAFDGMSSIEARIKMKEMEIQKHKNKIDELEAEKKALEEKLEEGDFEEFNMAMEKDVEDHPQWEKAKSIVDRKIASGDVRSPNHRVVEHWANTIGISREKLYEKVMSERGEEA